MKNPIDTFTAGSFCRQFVLSVFYNPADGGMLNLMAQTVPVKHSPMKMNAGIVTGKLAESKAFYIKTLGFELVFENDFYLLLNSPGGQASLSFLLANHPSQQPLFHKPFQGQGMYLTIDLVTYKEPEKK